MEAGDTGANGGGLDVELTARRDYFDAIVARSLARIEPVVDWISDLEGPRPGVRLNGRDFSPDTRVLIAGEACEITFQSPEVIDVHVPEHLTRFGPIVATSHPPARRYRAAQHGGDLAAPVTLGELTVSAPLPLRTETEFDLVCSFRASPEAPARLLSLSLRFPDGQIHEATYPISDEESEQGELVVHGLTAGRGGQLEASIAIYDDAGTADYLEAAFPVVPSNPVQLYVYPTSLGPSNWRGAAEYHSSDDRYYCYGRWVVSNGNASSVTVGGRVRCRVNDAGLGELADFTFDIGTTTVPAYSSRTLYVYTRHGSSSDVYDLFRDFGDASFTYSLQSSVGDLSDSMVFVAAAQVGVTANFVGNFSWNESVKVVDIIDQWSTGVYNDVDCIFSPGTPILEIPSSNSDWSRYRDIRVEEDKDDKCTDSDEADDLRDDWSSPGEFSNRIDIFFVESFSGDACASSLGGFSPVDGPASKGGDDSGIVIDVKDMNILTSTWGQQTLGVIIAHEVGHYLELEHTSASNNFMNPSVGPSNTVITYGQWKDVRDHFFVRRLNP